MVEIRGIVFKKGGFAIPGLNGPPVTVKPLLTVINFHLPNQWLPVLTRDGDNQRFDLMRPQDIAPVPERLLFVVFIFFHNNLVAVNEGGKIGDAWQVMQLC